MATLIPEYPFSEFKKLKAAELRELKSCEITADGRYLFTFLNPQTDFIRVQTEYHAQMGNALRGKTLEEITGKKPDATI